MILYHLAGKGAGERAILQDGCPVDDNEANAPGALDGPAASAGQVVDGFALGRADAVGIEENQVGFEAGTEKAPVGQAEDRGGSTGEVVNALLQGENALLAHPFLEDDGNEAGVAVGGEVGAGVRATGDRVRILEERADFVLLGGRDRPVGKARTKVAFG